MLYRLSASDACPPECIALENDLPCSAAHWNAALKTKTMSAERGNLMSLILSIHVILQ